MKLGLTILRTVVGGLFIGHGTQKLFGWFGGHGVEGTGGFFETLGYKPGKRAAIVAGASEAGGGALLVLGFLTPLASAAIIGAMAQAIEAVHGRNGPWATEGGWEYNAVIIAVAAALADTGPGDISLDHALGLDRFYGPACSVGALAAGVVGPKLLVHRGTPQAEVTPEEQAQADQALAA
jgi:putative oxidoreductase